MRQVEIACMHRHPQLSLLLHQSNVNLLVAWLRHLKRNVFELARRFGRLLGRLRLQLLGAWNLCGLGPDCSVRKLPVLFEGRDYCLRRRRSICP